MERGRFRRRWQRAGTGVGGRGSGGGGCRTEVPRSCRCRAAVERCYHQLCGGGQPEKHAFEAALTVYRWYHPEVPLPEAEAAVRTWLVNGALH